MELTQSKSKYMLLQVIEWYDAANLGTNGVIDPTKSSDSTDLSAVGYQAASSYLATEGVFFNPIADGGA